MARRRVIPNATFIDEVPDPAILCSAANIYFQTAIYTFSIFHKDTGVLLNTQPYRVVHVDPDDSYYAEVLFYDASDLSECEDKTLMGRIPCRYSESWWPSTGNILRELEDFAGVEHVSDDEIWSYMEANNMM